MPGEELEGAHRGPALQRRPLDGYSRQDSVRSHLLLRLPTGAPSQWPCLVRALMQRTRRRTPLTVALAEGHPNSLAKLSWNWAPIRDPPCPLLPPQRSAQHHGPEARTASPAPTLHSSQVFPQQSPCPPHPTLASASCWI